MRRWIGLLASGLVAVVVASTPATACSTFCIPNNGKPVFGRNYDWMVEDGYVIINQRNRVKIGASADNPPTWESKYGSVTFNQFGREMPCGGMNEAGLVVEVMMLSESAYPPPDDRPAVDVLQWVQYQLDMCATVDEVLATDTRLRVETNESPQHYLIADRSGRVATIEYIAGRMVVHTGKDLPVPVLTNTNYASSLAYLKLHKGFGGKGEIQRRAKSLDRFTCAADMVRTYDPASGRPVLEYAFDILDTVAQGDSTKWSIVYEVAAGRVHFRTHSARQIKTIDLTQLNFACTEPVMVAKMIATQAGDLSGNLTPYSYEQNREQIFSVVQQTPFLKETPEDSLIKWAQYPDSMHCRPTETVGTTP